MEKKEKRKKNIYIEKLKKAAEHGDAKAMYKLGIYYETGNYVAKNSNLAKKCYRESILLGNVDAAVHLYDLIDDNYSMDKNTSRLYKICESKDDPRIQLHLGRLYRYGDGVKVNHKKANYFFLKALNSNALNNIEECQALSEIGHCLLNGLGEKINLEFSKRIL